MTSRPDEHLDPEDRVFVDRLASHFVPPPLTPNQRAAFDMVLEERLEKRRRRSVFVPAFATLAAAAAVVVLTLTGRLGLSPTNPPTGGNAPVTLATPAMPSADEGEIDQWAYDLLAFNAPMTYPQAPNGQDELDESDEFDETNTDEQAEDNLLPDEYLAIESMFLEG